MVESAPTPQKATGTGIPRLSRLPVLNKRPSQVFATPIDPPVEPARNTTSTPKLQKRTSIASLPRSTQRSVQDAPSIAKPPTTTTRPARAAVANAAKPTARTLSRPGTTSGGPSSRANQQRLPPVSTKPAGAIEDEENHDQLGALDGFRTASRQGCRDEESPTEIAALAEGLTEDLFRPRDRSKSRPSLTERAIESLQGLPATPSAKARRNSNFFVPPESPMGPPPRPGSAMSRNGSNSSRPGTSDGTFAKPARSTTPPHKQSQSAKPATRKSLGGFGYTPGKQRSASSTLTQRLQASKDSKEAIPPLPRLSAASKQSGIPAQPNGRLPARPLNGSKTLAARPAKPKPSLNGVFATHAATQDSIQSEAGQAKRAVSNSANASSVALREQIAAAKAAARKGKVKHDSPLQVDGEQFEAFDSSTHADPFNQAPKDGKHILRNRIRSAWTDGKLNIAALDLKQLPEEVLHMYDTAAMEEAKVNWAEVVDVTKFIAADNEFEQLGDDIFPDKSNEEMAEDENGQGNQFGGLELLDLHGNMLQAVPMGLRRLERLTVLNLAHNKLDNDCLDVVSQISSLKELRLGHNNLAGGLPTSICALKSLEVLDLRANKILDLPDALRELVSLRVLNVAGNQLTTVPMDALHDLPLTELDASSNALIASLFPLGAINSHSTLQILNVANNSLAALVFAEGLGLPNLKMLDVTNNHLTHLPPVSAWTELITLAAGDNKIPELPAGFASLTKLRNVNFTSNELRVVDPEIARMDSLESLILASNPLREKKYLTMNAADIKRDLRSRLEPDDLDDGELSDPETVIGPDPAPGTARWNLKPNGVLDLAVKNISDDVNDALGSFLQSHEVKQLFLSSNKLTAIPPALWLGQDLRVLDLSSNAFTSDYFSADFELPALQELNLSKCRLTTIEPLMTQLTAPALRTLNISANRLGGDLPALRATFPALTTLFAADNKFISITAEALRGLTTVSLASNELQALPAEVGLLWDEGLKNLDVSSNAFRVPNYRVLEKGTESVLRWLRDRLPAPGAETEG